MIRPNFQKAFASHAPFSHARIPEILDSNEADRVLHWLRVKAPWALRVESFYEQYEFSLLKAELTPDVVDLTSPCFVQNVGRELCSIFSMNTGLTLVDIAAHRLISGHKIRIHNDYIEEQETHRLLIQLNDGWSVDRGGLLMLFADSQPESVASVVVPTHASGFAFEISPRSYHAVSSIKGGERYTLVYTFRTCP